MTKLTELDIKANIITKLRRDRVLTRNCIIANEFRLGRTTRRADLAIVGEQFIGIEIKSEKDSLRRLSAQLEEYMNFFDLVIVILASKHLSKADSLEIQENVELWEVDSCGNFVPFLRGISPRKTRKSPILLLTQAEKRQFVLRAPEAPNDNSNSHGKSDFAAFKGAFASRYTNSSAQFWRAIGRRKAVAKDIAHLSRYFDRRQEIRRVQETNARRWSEWHSKADAYFGDSTSP